MKATKGLKKTLDSSTLIWYSPNSPKGRKGQAWSYHFFEERCFAVSLRSSKTTRISLLGAVGQEGSPSSSIAAANYRGGLGDSVNTPTNIILRAAAVARDAHKGLERKYSGRPYITHPGRVAARASILPGATEALVAAAWLHDTVEDTDLTLWDITESFGEEVAVIVEGLTNKFDKASYPDMNRKARKKAEHERLHKETHDVKVLKLLDRIDNLREMSPKDEGFIKLYIRESRDLLIAVGDADLGLGRELQAVIDELGREIL